jgi:hypothetical protein
MSLQGSGDFEKSSSHNGSQSSGDFIVPIHEPAAEGAAERAAEEEAEDIIGNYPVAPCM